jgi:Major Facilitator Superfamily
VSLNVKGATPETELDVKMVASAPGKDDERIHPARPMDVSGDIEKASRTLERHALGHIDSHISHHELHGVVSQHTEINAAQYERFSEQRKLVITAVLSLCGFLAPISSTSILSAVPEVAAEYRTTGSIINLSNALYLISMGLSPCLWGPLSQVYGRRWVCWLEQLAQLSLTHHLRYAS